MSPPDKPAPDLTFSKVLASAGAAATAAVVGALFGVAGTVLGAAIGAVAITVGTSVYQRSIDRASSSIIARIRPGDPEATVVLPAEPATVLISPAPVPAPRFTRRRVIGYVVASVLGFAIALGAVTGVEAITGSTLVTGEAGTSVGRVIGGGAATPATESNDDTSEATQDDQRRDARPTSAPTTSATATPAPTSAPAPSTSAPSSASSTAGSTPGADRVDLLPGSGASDTSR